MIANVFIGQQARFNVGSVILLVAAALMTLNHGVLIFVLDEPMLFVGYAAFNLYALVVIALPLRRRERWAWYVTSTLPAGLAIPAFIEANLASAYYTVAAACVVGLLLTRRGVFEDLGI